MSTLSHVFPYSAGAGEPADRGAAEGGGDEADGPRDGGGVRVGARQGEEPPGAALLPPLCDMGRLALGQVRHAPGRMNKLMLILGSWPDKPCAVLACLGKSKLQDMELLLASPSMPGPNAVVVTTAFDCRFGMLIIGCSPVTLQSAVTYAKLKGNFAINFVNFNCAFPIPLLLGLE